MSDSKATIALKAQYKQEKEAGTTTVKSFVAWNEDRLELLAADLEAAKSTTAPVILIVEPTIEEVVIIAEAALEVITQTIEAAEPIITTITATLTKADIARQLYDEAEAKATAEHPLIRKTIIDLFMSVAGLSKPGASTYYQNIRRAKGLITS